MFVGKEKRNLTIEEEKIIHTICAEFKKTFPQTEVQQKKTVVGIGDPSKHLFCYFIDKDTGFKIKFKSQKVFYNPFEDLSKQISETITLFQKNDFPLSHHKTNTLIPETNPSVLENKQYGILTKEENIFFKILLNNIDPQTGEILQICSESLSILKNVYLRCLN